MAGNFVTDVQYNNSVSMQTFLNEYNEMLIGKRKSFSPMLLDKEFPEKTCAEILKVIFNKYFGWAPNQIRDCLTPEIASRMNLAPLIKRLPVPDGILEDKELCYVAWYLYPETKNISESDLVIRVYKHLMNGEIQRFPKNYFLSHLGSLRAKLIFRVAMHEYILPKHSFNSLEELYTFFVSDKITAVINECKLTTMIKQKAGIPLNMFHMSIEGSGDNLLYLRALESSTYKDKWDQCLLSDAEVIEATSGLTPVEFDIYRRRLNRKNTGCTINETTDSKVSATANADDDEFSQNDVDVLIFDSEAFDFD